MRVNQVKIYANNITNYMIIIFLNRSIVDISKHEIVDNFLHKNV